jgi:hypothetical protein
MHTLTMAPPLPHRYTRLIELWFLFSLMWSMGGTVDDDSRKLIDAAGTILYDAFHVGELGPDGARAEEQHPLEPVAGADQMQGAGAGARHGHGAAQDRVEEALAVAPASTLGDLLASTPGLRSTSFAPGASAAIWVGKRTLLKGIPSICSGLSR